MSDQVVVTKDIAAPAATVWALVSDLPRMGEWSPENRGGQWVKGATGPVPGARFKGENRNGDKSWSTDAKVVDAEPGRRFSFRRHGWSDERRHVGVRHRGDRGRVPGDRDLDGSAWVARQEGRRLVEWCRGSWRVQPCGDGADPRPDRCCCDGRAVVGFGRGRIQARTVNSDSRGPSIHGGRARIRRSVARNAACRSAGRSSYGDD